MGVPSSKVELLEAIESSFCKLQKEFDRVPVEAARNQVLPGHNKGTIMSPADLLAYLVGWGNQVMAWHQRREAGLSDEFPAAGIKWNELGLLAERYYAEHDTDSWASLRSQLVSSKECIIDLVKSHSDRELYGTSWYGKWTKGRMISLNTSSPYANARGRLRAWLRDKN
ncbi:ClbS/DfsB family four-helix bundle protein [Leucobacter sp. Marseille-Q4368]|uniref:ClbS/DfsB family four-helix bundle protein n=2 Tax=Leucobacter manosquensis TaxID=2810611 RepID=A0ABS5M5F1_9MICO|nr:ClbS/DfsB family four-helix bundle protein [Leucobacter manosquensis]